MDLSKFAKLRHIATGYTSYGAQDSKGNLYPFVTFASGIKPEGSPYCTQSTPEAAWDYFSSEVMKYLDVRPGIVHFREEPTLEKQGDGWIVYSRFLVHDGERLQELNGR